MNKLPCTLISESGEEFTFDSTSCASRFLHRTKGYVASNTCKGLPLTDGITGELFEFKCDESKRNTVAHVRRRIQPCCNCKKFAGGCSWSRSFTPVEGWTAVPTLINHGGHKGYERLSESYMIIKCPEFERG